MANTEDIKNLRNKAITILQQLPPLTEDDLEDEYKEIRDTIDFIRAELISIETPLSGSEKFKKKLKENEDKTLNLMDTLLNSIEKYLKPEKSKASILNEAVLLDIAVLERRILLMEIKGSEPRIEEVKCILKKNLETLLFAYIKINLNEDNDREFLTSLFADFLKDLKPLLLTVKFFNKNTIQTLYTKILLPIDKTESRTDLKGLKPSLLDSNEVSNLLNELFTIQKMKIEDIKKSCNVLDKIKNFRIDLIEDYRQSHSSLQKNNEISEKEEEIFLKIESVLSLIEENLLLCYKNKAVSVLTDKFDLVSFKSSFLDEQAKFKKSKKENLNKLISFFKKKEATLSDIVDNIKIAKEGIEKYKEQLNQRLQELDILSDALTVNLRWPTPEPKVNAEPLKPKKKKKKSGPAEISEPLLTVPPSDIKVRKLNRVSSLKSMAEANSKYLSLDEYTKRIQMLFKSSLMAFMTDYIKIDLSVDPKHERFSAIFVKFFNKMDKALDCSLINTLALKNICSVSLLHVGKKGFNRMVNCSPEVLNIEKLENLLESLLNKDLEKIDNERKSAGINQLNKFESELRLFPIHKILQYNQLFLAKKNEAISNTSNMPNTIKNKLATLQGYRECLEGFEQCLALFPSNDHSSLVLKTGKYSEKNENKIRISEDDLVNEWLAKPVLEAINSQMVLVSRHEQLKINTSQKINEALESINVLDPKLDWNQLAEIMDAVIEMYCLPEKEAKILKSLDDYEKIEELPLKMKSISTAIKELSGEYNLRKSRIILFARINFNEKKRELIQAISTNPGEDLERIKKIINEKLNFYLSEINALQDKKLSLIETRSHIKEITENLIGLVEKIRIVTDLNKKFEEIKIKLDGFGCLSFFNFNLNNIYGIERAKINALEASELTVADVESRKNSISKNLDELALRFEVINQLGMQFQETKEKLLNLRYLPDTNLGDEIESVKKISDIIENKVTTIIDKKLAPIKTKISELGNYDSWCSIQAEKKTTYKELNELIKQFQIIIDLKATLDKAEEALMKFQYPPDADLTKFDEAQKLQLAVYKKCALQLTNQHLIRTYRLEIDKFNHEAMSLENVQSIKTNIHKNLEELNSQFKIIVQFKENLKQAKIALEDKKNKEDNAPNPLEQIFQKTTEISKFEQGNLLSSAVIDEISSADRELKKIIDGYKRSKIEYFKSTLASLETELNKVKQEDIFAAIKGRVIDQSTLISDAISKMKEINTSFDSAYSCQLMPLFEEFDKNKSKTEVAIAELKALNAFSQVLVGRDRSPEKKMSTKVIDKVEVEIHRIIDKYIDRAIVKHRDKRLNDLKNNKNFSNQESNLLNLIDPRLPLLLEVYNAFNKVQSDYLSLHQNSERLNYSQKKLYLNALEKAAQTCLPKKKMEEFSNGARNSFIQFIRREILAPLKYLMPNKIKGPTLFASTTETTMFNVVDELHEYIQTSRANNLQ